MYGAGVWMVALYMMLDWFDSGFVGIEKCVYVRNILNCTFDYAILECCGL